MSIKAKVNSQILTMAQLGIDKLKSIDPNLDLGNGLTLQSFTTNVEQMRTTIANYNTAAAELEKLNRQMKEQEIHLADLIRRMIFAIGAKFGAKSEEYKMIKKIWQLTRRRKTQPTAPTETPVTSIDSEPAPAV